MQEERGPGILAIATKYGLIQGVLSFIIFLVPPLTGIKQSWTISVAGIATLIVLMVLAHLEFRRTHNGKLTYPQGLGSGTLLASIAALLGCVLEYVYVTFINTGYIAAALQAQRAVLAQRGITGAQAQQAMSITAAITTPVGIAVISLISGVVVGFIVALVVSIFTQKDPMAI
jgi:hypothetical protein